MKMNINMASKLRDINWVDQILVTELKNISDASFIKINDCVFLNSLYKVNTNVSLQNFPDKTGYECFINSLHIDDYVSNGYLSQSCLFVKSVFERWRQFSGNEILQAIIAIGEFDAVVKFHLLRDGENLLNDDLEGYEEAMLIVDSSWETGVETL